MSTWDKLIEVPTPQAHFVQFYDTGGDALARNVCRYLGEGLTRGEGVVAIATRQHEREFRRLLKESDVGADQALRDGRLLFFDAHATLATFMVGGRPDWDRFQEVVGTVLARVRRVTGDSGLRAYGEMVDVLWGKRQFAAAVRLEQFWNKLLSRSSFSLYCAYAIDVFGQEFRAASLDGVLCAHTHVVPIDTRGDFEAALDRALKEISGPAADDLKLEIRAHRRPFWGVMADGERIALWLRTRWPRHADEIMSRARKHYESKRLKFATA